jgi:hypothetical protein
MLIKATLNTMSYAALSNNNPRMGRKIKIMKKKKVKLAEQKIISINRRTTILIFLEIGSIKLQLS